MPELFVSSANTGTHEVTAVPKVKSDVDTKIVLNKYFFKNFHSYFSIKKRFLRNDYKSFYFRHMIAIIKSCFELKIIRETAIIYLLTNTICIKTSQPLYQHIQELTLSFF